ncbi:MAG: NAD(P)H-binding protein [Thalassolituus oleivorans]|uniref:NAD-dependent epimerase/dehydratase family protein n=1 Tax=Thalassolituus oleivorans TaxID=187493 RepID=UPI001B5F96DE|nr:NAD-dependent epimerase/dehydratase family protein [Thalassolituus oleivorans]MBQ0728265.1 NAD(P)H-binding protein [Thalassolituus oleivorans]MBQ0781946.1 NAD(P)H-binding protein [Thalassolituus oleivorans]
MARILIVGTGDIGGHLAESLVQQGHDVWGIRRSNKPVAEGVTVISADVADAETLIDLPTELDIVVYSVASPVFSKEGYHNYYVKGLKNILKAVKDQSPKRVIFVSSSSVYHQMDGEWVDETSETKPSSFAGKEMLAAEEALNAAHVPSTSVRFTGIYGPGRTRMIEQARHGGYCDPEPAVWTNRIHRDDCIGVLNLLINKSLAGETLDNLYLATDDEPAPLFDVLEWMKDRIGEVDPDNDVGEVSRRANRRCSNKRLRALGYEFKFVNYRDGYDVMLNDMGLV